jgi:hypothetical protein
MSRRNPTLFYLTFRANFDIIIIVKIKENNMIIEGIICFLILAIGILDIATGEGMKGFYAIGIAVFVFVFSIMRYFYT